LRIYNLISFTGQNITVLRNRNTLVPSHSVGKQTVSFSFLSVVPRSHDNDPIGSTKSKALLGIQWDYKRW